MEKRSTLGQIGGPGPEKSNFSKSHPNDLEMVLNCFLRIKRSKKTFEVPLEWFRPLGQNFEKLVEIRVKNPVLLPFSGASHEKYSQSVLKRPVFLSNFN